MAAHACSRAKGSGQRPQGSGGAGYGGVASVLVWSRRVPSLPEGIDLASSCTENRMLTVLICPHACDAAGQQQAASGVDGVRPRCGHVPLPCMAYHRGCRPRAHAPGDGAPRPCLSNRRHRRRLERHSLVRRHVLCWSGGKGRHGLVHLGGRPDHYQPPCGAGRRPSGKHRGE
jgi:hypothetical protein